MALAAPPPLALLGDSPYAGDSDPLGFSNLAEDLAQLILGSRGATPFTLGVEASWGMGKSTLMGRLYARLEHEDAVKPVWFNAWTADDNVAFFYTSRVTTARTAAAHALGAEVVSGPTELISALREAVARSRTA